MGIAGNEWGFQVGTLPKGARDKISDVPGVTVGHCTLADGVVQTGVTALLPHQGDIFHEKVLAASYVINGFGKTTGLVQIDELGTLETPILFTNTLSVGTAQTALVKYMLEKNPDICETTGSVNPVVCECNDCGLNDIRGRLQGRFCRGCRRRRTGNALPRVERRHRLRLPGGGTGRQTLHHGRTGALQPCAVR